MMEGLMESQLERLADKAWRMYQETPLDLRLLIGIAGIPGSGKTRLAQIITKKLNNRAQSLPPDSASPPSPLAVCLPLDGFHLTRAALSAMPDSVTAHARRGAAFTFDAPQFLALVQALRLRLSEGNFILAPSFDHAVKDPKDGDIKVLPTHRIVILEGLYLALDKEVWRDAGALLDELWFVEVDLELARRRLRKRHVQAGIAKDVEEGDKMVMENDMINSREIMNYRVVVHDVIHSREVRSWV